MDSSESLLHAVALLTEITVFLVGLCVGSFLNVVIARLPEGISIVSPRSRCPKCGSSIAWYDNIPVLSWLLLLGRCRGCRTPIAIRYPTVELLVGLLALAVYRQEGLTVVGGCFFAFVALLVAITYIDLDHWIIPWELTIPGILLGLVQSFFNPRMSWFDSAVGAVAGFSVFALIALLGRLIFRKEALGEGDWWLLAMIGAFLGWKALLPVILLASLQGSVIGILLIVAGRGEPGPEEKPASDAPPSADSAAESPAPAVEAAETKAEDKEKEEEEWVPPRNAVPFGPFLALAALEQLFIGDWLRMLYDHLLQRLMV